MCTSSATPSAADHPPANASIGEALDAAEATEKQARGNRDPRRARATGQTMLSARGPWGDKPCRQACRRMSVLGPRASPGHVVLLELVAELPERHAKELGGLRLHVAGPLHRL